MGRGLLTLVSLFSVLLPDSLAFARFFQPFTQGPKLDFALCDHVGNSMGDDIRFGMNQVYFKVVDSMCYQQYDWKLFPALNILFRPMFDAASSASGHCILTHKQGGRLS